MTSINYHSSNSIPAPDAPIFTVVGDEIFIHNAHEYGVQQYENNAIAQRASRDMVKAGYHRVNSDTMQLMYPSVWEWGNMTPIHKRTPRTIANAITGLMLNH